MMTCKADNRSRVKLPDIKPGTVFELTQPAAGQFTLVEVAPKEPPVVNPIKCKNGLYRWPVKLTKAQVAAAIRADRDER